jgi:hypothetical protein
VTCPVTHQLRYSLVGSGLSVAVETYQNLPRLDVTVLPPITVEGELYAGVPFDDVKTNPWPS